MQGSQLADQPAGGRVLANAAAAAATYYTPERESGIGSFLETSAPYNPQIARAAGLMDVAARWMVEARHAYELIPLEQSRMCSAEAAAALERLAKMPVNNDNSQTSRFLMQAAKNYGLAGQPRNELRALGELEQSGGLTGRWLERYGELLRTSAPDGLVALAGPGTPRFATARPRVRSRDRTPGWRYASLRTCGCMPAVWQSAYTALTGLYFGHTTAETSGAFEAALGPRTIGEQIAVPADRGRQLAGDDWFYYGARYGEYLALAGGSGVEDFVVAELEGRPASAGPYMALGDWYRGNGNRARAIAEYGRALELAPGRADAHSRLAEIYAESGDRPQALAEWRKAIAALSAHARIRGAYPRSSGPD